jgi:hypothetical protein
MDYFCNEKAELWIERKCCVCNKIKWFKYKFGI